MLLTALIAVLIPVQDPDLKRIAFERASAFLKDALELQRKAAAACKEGSDAKAEAVAFLKILEDRQAGLKPDGVSATVRTGTGFLIHENPRSNPGILDTMKYGEWVEPGPRHVNNLVLGSCGAAVDWTAFAYQRVEASIVSVECGLADLFGEILLVKSVVPALPPKDRKTRELKGVLVGTDKGHFSIAFPGQKRSGPFYGVVGFHKDLAELVKSRFRWVRMTVEIIVPSESATPEVSLVALVSMEPAEPDEEQRKWIDERLPELKRLYGD